MKKIASTEPRRNGKGMNIIYSRLKIQNYLSSEDIDVSNDERKLILQLRTKINFKVKSHFRRMHIDTICDGCRVAESTTEHSLECQTFSGKNELVTYLPNYTDLYGNDEN